MQRLDVLRLKAVLHGADIHGDGLRCNRCRGDHTVHHALGCGQICKGAAVDLCHHLAGVHLGGIHCQNDVRLVQTGQRHKGVHLGDALLAQQLGVRAVPVDDQHAGELLAHFLAAGRIAVDDGDALLDVLQLLDEVVGHPACADDHDIVCLLLKEVQPAEEGLKVPGRGGQIDLIPRLQRKGTGGYDRLTAACDRTDQDLDADVAVEVCQLQADQRVVLGQAVFDQLKPLAAELLALDGRGEAQHPRDLAGGGLFRVDDHRQAQLIAHKAQLLLILRVADTSNGVLRAELFRHKAGKDVDLIAGGRGNQKIRTVLERLLLDLIAATVAGHAAHIIDVYNILDQVRVLVDNDNVIVFRRKLGGQGTADFAKADDHDSHTNAPFLLLQVGAAGKPCPPLQCRDIRQELCIIKPIITKPQEKAIGHFHGLYKIF